MNFDKPAGVPEAEATPLPRVDSTAATLGRMQQQLEQQNRLLQAIHQELNALREAQTGYSATLIKLDRQLRWQRWSRRVRTALFLLFWLAIGAVLASYWQDLANIWNDWAGIFL